MVCQAPPVLPAGDPAATSCIFALAGEPADWTEVPMNSSSRGVVAEVLRMRRASTTQCDDFAVGKSPGTTVLSGARCGRLDALREQ